MRFSGLCHKLGLLMLLAALSCPALAASCLYADRSQGGFLTMHDDCGEPADADAFILPHQHFKRLAFDRNGLSCVLVGGNAYYFRRDGQSRRVVYFDNGCDYFEEGLARAYAPSGMVYVDKSLAVVLQPGFEWADSFSAHHAVVCNGPFTTEQLDNEHPLMRGGHCGLIDRQGRLVVAAKYSIDEQQVFRNYVNSHNECPPPPITTEATAICHARRHMHATSFYPQQAARKVAWVRQTPSGWQVGFAWCSRFHCNPVVELDAETAGFRSIVPGKAR